MNERNAGRKKKTATEKRTKKISLYLNDLEYEYYMALKEKYKNFKPPLSVKDFLRYAILKEFTPR
jgi:hypothetical protein